MGTRMTQGHIRLSRCDSEGVSQRTSSCQERCPSVYVCVTQGRAPA